MEGKENMNASFKKAHHREKEVRQFCFDVAEMFGGRFERRLHLSRFVMKCPFDQVVVRGCKIYLVTSLHRELLGGGGANTIFLRTTDFGGHIAI